MIWKKYSLNKIREKISDNFFRTFFFLESPEMYAKILLSKSEQKKIFDPILMKFFVEKK